MITQRILVLTAALWWMMPPALALPPVKPDLSGLKALTPEQVRMALKSLDGTFRLPITGLSMAVVNGQTLLLSENGRIAILGDFRMVDLWGGKDIQSLADAETLNRIDLKKIGIQDGDLGEIRYGTGKTVVTIFIDPLCPHCHDLLQQLEPLKNDYTFKLLMAPVLGRASVDLSTRLTCAKDKQKVLQALLDQKYDPFTTTQCDLAPLQKTVVTARILGITGVPYILLPSTRTHRGGTKNLKELLENDARKPL